MQFKLKSISKRAVSKAIEKAMRYRLLNEPSEAESICLDVLKADNNNQKALIVLLLALTDRFGIDEALSDTQAEDVTKRLQDEYEQAYYSGIICERKGKASLTHGGPSANYDACEWLCEAMTCFKKAETIRPKDNDDALLRWNACARIIMSNHLDPRPPETFEPSLE
ncbi:MAG TPA: hypothetical protein EYQ50_24470 [Verrucomicrobiales bacterium]|nr:hypothetical protein [Verrucomicrobiales bacterium]